MTSKEVVNYIEKEGIDKLYKRFEKYFIEVDNISEEFATGDLLDEYRLSFIMDRLTGIFMKFNIIAEAIDSYKTNLELDYSVSRFKDKDKKLSVAQIEKEARQSTNNLREYRGDFLNYATSAEKGILTCQARIKRLSFEKAARGVDATGDLSNAVKKEVPGSGGWE